MKTSPSLRREHSDAIFDVGKRVESALERVAVGVIASFRASFGIWFFFFFAKLVLPIIKYTGIYKNKFTNN